MNFHMTGVVKPRLVFLVILRMGLEVKVKGTMVGLCGCSTTLTHV